ncbi:MAG: lipopolysaccharide ABC transporter substrate-binding protein LptA [Candidatus Arsenophonus melophagi]|nr:lipopolysaccharide ABC transporter substrate-binding protein LptA [Candidatus Arsenophonus melophagi]
MIKKIFLKLTLTSSILILSLPGMALKSDSEHPILIESVKQLLDLKNHITIFIKNVVIKHGPINVLADKVVVVCPNGDSKKMVVEAYGTPVAFNQLQDDGKLIKGHSDKIRYEMEKELIILMGHAYLEQLDSNIQGDTITYLVPTQQMEAFSDPGNLVKTVLLPSQLQEKVHSIEIKKHGENK